MAHGEWIKLVTVRSTWWCAAVCAAAVLVPGWLAAAVTDRADTAGIALAAALTGFGPGQLVLVVLGVLAGAGEFTTGMAVATFGVVPRRARVLAAKTVVLAAVASGLSLVLAVGCVLAARTLTVVPGGVPLTRPDVVRAVVLQAVWAGLLAVLSVAAGTLLRSVAGGIGVVLALVLVLPPLLAADDRPLTRALGDALPALRVGADPFLAGPGPWQPALLAHVAWAAGAGLLAAAVLERRDV